MVAKYESILYIDSQDNGAEISELYGNISQEIDW